MQNIISEIFDALDGSTAIANGIGSPVQTVNDWLNKGAPEIPPWRRSDVLNFAKRSGKMDKLSAECVAYLCSHERTVRKSAA